MHTTSQIAAVRTSETRLPEDERVFYDPYAELFLPDEMRAGFDDVDEIRAAISRYEQMLRQFVEGEGALLLFGIVEGKVEEFFQQRRFAAIKSVSAPACKAKHFNNTGS